VLTLSLGINGMMDELANVTYFMAERQDATIGFFEKKSRDVVYAVARLPGVIAVEPSRNVPVRIRKGSLERRVVMSGRQRGADLNRVIDTTLRPVAMPEVGL